MLVVLETTLCIIIRGCVFVNTLVGQNTDLKIGEYCYPKKRVCNARFTKGYSCAPV